MSQIQRTQLAAISPPEVKGAEISLRVLTSDGESGIILAEKSIWRSLVNFLALTGIEAPRRSPDPVEKPAVAAAVAQGPAVPSVGRIVGYVLPPGHRRAGEVVPAIITRTWHGPSPSWCVQLTPFVDQANDNPVEATQCSSVIYSEELKPRSWHWLPRQP